MKLYTDNDVKALEGMNLAGTCAWLADALSGKIKLPIGMPGDRVQDSLSDICLELKEPTLGRFLGAVEAQVEQLDPESFKERLQVLYHVVSSARSKQADRLTAEIGAKLGIKKFSEKAGDDGRDNAPENYEKYDKDEKK